MQILHGDPARLEPMALAALTPEDWKTFTTQAIYDLLYLCFHAVDHPRFLHVGPRALLDVTRLIAEPPRQIDWDDVISRTHELGWVRGSG